MDKQSVIIRTARIEDASQILNVYAPYVEKTAITFEYEVPSVSEFERRIQNTLLRYPYIVAIVEKQIVGYAYVGVFHDRPAYDWSVETSIYVSTEHKGEGIGKLLYQELECILKRQGVLNLNACIAYTDKEDSHLTNDSVSFHEHLGYRMVGIFHQCGYKFDHWYHMVWMEKMIGEHKVPAKTFIPFSEL